MAKPPLELQKFFVDKIQFEKCNMKSSKVIVSFRIGVRDPFKGDLFQRLGKNYSHKDMEKTPYEEK